MVDTGKLRAFASCNTDLLDYMEMMVADNSTDTLRVTRIAIPAQDYTCGCGKPAEWYVLRVPGMVESIPDPAYIKDTEGFNRWRRQRDDRG